MKKSINSFVMGSAQEVLLDYSASASWRVMRRLFMSMWFVVSLFIGVMLFIFDGIAFVGLVTYFAGLASMLLYSSMAKAIDNFMDEPDSRTKEMKRHERNEWIVYIGLSIPIIIITIIFYIV